jgi:hypothetical protein
VAHHGEQNGDLMRDPEMCFELSKPLLCETYLVPYYWRNDYVGIEQYSRRAEGIDYIFDRELYNQHLNFAALWDQNLREQGFLQVFTNKSLRG